MVRIGPLFVSISPVTKKQVPVFTAYSAYYFVLETVKDTSIFVGSHILVIIVKFNFYRLSNLEELWLVYKSVKHLQYLSQTLIARKTCTRKLIFFTFVRCISRT